MGVFLVPGEFLQFGLALQPRPFHALPNPRPNNHSHVLTTVFSHKQHLILFYICDKLSIQASKYLIYLFLCGGATAVLYILTFLLRNPLVVNQIGEEACI